MLKQGNLIFSSLGQSEKSFLGGKGINFRIIPLLLDRLSIEHPRRGRGEEVQAEVHAESIYLSVIFLRKCDLESENTATSTKLSHFYSIYIYLRHNKIFQGRF
jgi:hypothetical protein